MRLTVGILRPCQTLSQRAPSGFQLIVSSEPLILNPVIDRLASVAAEGSGPRLCQSVDRQRIATVNAQECPG